MENQTKKRPKADIDLEIKLPNKEKPFYNKLSTADNMIKQIKKAGSKLDEYQTLDVWINKNKNIVLSKNDILTDNLKEKILDRITLLGELEKAEKSANSIGIEFGYKSDEKGIKTYNVNGNPLTTEKDFIIHVKHKELNHHKEQSDKWAMELSNRTDLSKGLTISQIDEKQAMHYRFYEQKAKELGVEVTPFIEKLVINREINKGMEQNTNIQNNQPANNVAENQNFKFLKDQIKYLGFGEEPKLLKELENKILSGEKSFELKVDYDKTSFQNKASFQLNFNRSESTGNYFLNTYKANLQNEKRNVNIDHTFAVKTNGFTAKQAVNLLEGRSVLATINNPKTKEEEKAFIKLKLDETKNENGNFKLQVFNKNYGVDTAKIVENSKLKFDDDKHKDITIKSLERGNIVGVKFEHDKKIIEGKAVLNPQYKTLNLYDQNMKRVNTNKPVISEQQEMENNSKQTYKQSR